MTTLLKNKLFMVDGIISILNRYAAIVSAFPALAAAAQKLLTLREQIQNVYIAHQKVLSGITVDKSNSKMLCQKLMVTIAKALLAYGHSVTNNNLIATAKLYVADAKHYGDEDLTAIARMMYNKAYEYATDLVDFGITEDTFNAFDAAIIDFTDKMPDPREARESKKMHTIQLDDLFSKTMNLLRNEIDPLVGVLGDDSIEFKTLYKNGRNVITFHRKRKKTSLVSGFGILYGNVTDENENPIEEATVSVQELNVSTTTDEDGSYYFESLACGNYTLKVSMPTYVDQVESKIEIKDNEETEMNFCLLPVLAVDSLV